MLPEWRFCKINIANYIPSSVIEEVVNTKYYREKTGFLRDKEGSCPLGLICYIIGDDDAPFVPTGREFANYLFEFGYIEEEDKEKVSSIAWQFIIKWETNQVSDIRESLS